MAATGNAPRHHARDATDVTVLAHHEAVEPAEPLRIDDLLLRVLDGLDLVAPLLVDRRSRHVAVRELLQRQDQIAREVLQRDREALRTGGEERGVLGLRSHDLDRPHARVAVGDRQDAWPFGLAVMIVVV